MLLLVLKNAKKIPNGKYMENFLKLDLLTIFILQRYFEQNLILLKFNFSQTLSFNRISIKIRIFAKKLQNSGLKLNAIP